MKKEIWKPIKGFEGWYEVSSLGRVRSVERKIEHAGSHPKTQIARSNNIKPQKNNKGYLFVMLYKNSKHTKRYIHRLVAEAFIPNQEKKKEVNHKDCNPENCCVENLEWVTRQENIDHAVRCGRIDQRMKPVTSFDTVNGEVKRYRSVAEAARQNGCSHSLIVQACQKKVSTAKGKKWEYSV